jgi:AAA+ ATPase superfamily predicted ATPase
MPKLLNQFRSFYFRNYPNDMETQIDYFSVFGGLGWDIDTSKNIEALLHEVVFDNFDIIYEKMEQITLQNNENHRLLKALAVGDRRIFSAFNRAGLNNANGGSALKYLQERGVVQIEYSREEDPRELNPHAKLKREVARHRISHKVLFTQPFVRFWFYFIAPHIKEIQERDYTNVLKRFKERQSSYTSLVFEELSEILLNYHIRDSQIVSSGSYWDAKIEIDILTITDTDKIYVAECKWKNHKVNKSELHKLLDKCERLDIEPTQVVFFSKRGFSKELHSLEGKDLALYSVKDFKTLLKNSSKDELIDEFI